MSFIEKLSISGQTMLIGLAVVFAVLALLIGCIKIMGSVMQEKKPAQKAQSPAPAPAPAPVRPRANADDEDDDAPAEPSDLEKRISNAYEGLEFGQSRSDTIVSFNSNHIIDLGEEAYLCDVTYEVDTLGRDGELHRSVNNAWLFLVRADDALKVDRLLTY